MKMIVSTISATIGKHKSTVDGENKHDTKLRYKYYILLLNKIRTRKNGRDHSITDNFYERDTSIGVLKYIGLAQILFRIANLSAKMT